MALLQKRKSIRALHEAIGVAMPERRVLEVSSASESDLGQRLSAFNLTFETARGREIPVECAFQSAKVFENGGPFGDLLNVRPIDAKRDPRLIGSGRLVGFRWRDRDWPLEPQTAFYDWIYLNALHRRADLAVMVMDYDAFTDIAFNPSKSINCQAGSAALYTALRARGLIDEAMSAPDRFLSVMNKVSSALSHADQQTQARLL